MISFGQFFEYELIGFSVVHIFLFLREDSGRFGFLYGFGVVFAVLAMAVGVWYLIWGRDHGFDVGEGLHFGVFHWLILLFGWSIYITGQ